VRMKSVTAIVWSRGSAAGVGMWSKERAVEEGFSVTHENENIYFGNGDIYCRMKKGNEVQL
jgi:hypothetical protein